jgi:hypothetical protein
MRRIPAQFSWVDQRLVRDRHLDRLDAVAAALYLFLITVADVQGLSWYGDTSTARRLSIDEARLRRARADLVRAGLLAYARGLYQVLALDTLFPSPPPTPPTPSPPPTLTQDAGIVATLPVPVVALESNPAAVREHLAGLYAALEKRR